MERRKLSIGKLRALQRATTKSGHFNILAIDHQDSLKRVLNTDSPSSVSDDELIAFKHEVVSALMDKASGVLLDPVYGAFQAITHDTLGSKGLIVELEKADYQLEPLPLDVEIDPDWSVAKIKMMHADGVKLFFYYNPYNVHHAKRQEAVVSQVVIECEQQDIPLYAEPIVYDISNKPEAVLESAKRIAALGVDVLKLEFPVDVEQENDESVWLKSCQAISKSVDIPWVLLSAGAAFEMYAQQLEIACKAGASGYMVGRALWGDAAKVTRVDERLGWLNEVAVERVEQLNAIVEMHASSFVPRHLAAPPVITTDTFRRYPNFEDADHD